MLHLRTHSKTQELFLANLNVCILQIKKLLQTGRHRGEKVLPPKLSAVTFGG